MTQTDNNNLSNSIIEQDSDYISRRLSEVNSIILDGSSFHLEDGLESSDQLLVEDGSDNNDTQSQNNNIDEPQDNEQAVITTPLRLSDSDDVKESSFQEEEPLTIPQSTHSFLFTEPATTMPFYFGLGISVMSFVCLILALVDNVENGEVPFNVPISVRIAQYLSIVIALLMEEELPTGLYLLRRISRPYLASKFPEIKYSSFVCSCILRITMGYLFLINVIVILVQASGVVDIFYDVLALQFIQQLDDIAFALCKMDVLGKRLQRASMTPYYTVEFQKQKNETMAPLKRRIKIFLKGAYFVNLLAFLAAMVVVTVRQNSNYYQCKSITVRIQEEVWEEAYVKWPADSVQLDKVPGTVEEMMLVYSWFNGVYVIDGSRTNEGRPIYVEQKKTDGTPFDGDSPFSKTFNTAVNRIVPAEIKYCDGHWVFVHEYISKSRVEELDESNCNWLLRSPETDTYDFLEVGDGKWEIWAGVISETTVSSKCNLCENDSDCNLNGDCNLDTGKCECHDHLGDNITFIGTHCEVRVKDQCRTIISEDGDRWSIDVARNYSSDLFESYSRPTYIYVDGLPEDDLPESDDLALLYSGNRWFTVFMQGARSDDVAYWDWQTANYHSFWSEVYKPGTTLLISDPTTLSTPVGVDFYSLGEQGHQYGPFGVLNPIHNVSGRGAYRCEGIENVCSFCPGGVVDDFVIPGSDNVTCGVLPPYASTLDPQSSQCTEVRLAEQFCCLNQTSTVDNTTLDTDTGNSTTTPSGTTCPFCLDKSIDKSITIPEFDTNCAELEVYASSLNVNTDPCNEILPAEAICCA